MEMTNVYTLHMYSTGCSYEWEKGKKGKAKKKINK